MAANIAKYFNGTEQLSYPYYESDRAKFPSVAIDPDNMPRLYKHGQYPVGTNAKGEKVIADRIIFYKKRPSKHKCDARCMNAKGTSCECSCGGANHGAGA